jgi:glycosyltransferase involved in cell wall biosynthesis
MVRLASVYDVGLSSEPGHNPNNRLALGNKVFTYILAGLPVLLSDVPAHRAFAAEVGSAAQLYPVENCEALAAAIDVLLSAPQVLTDARDAAFHVAQSRFNWDVEQNTLLGCVRQATISNI